MSSVVRREHWIRLILLVDVHVKDALLCVLHNKFGDPSYIGLPSNKVDLYNAIEKREKQLRNTKKISKDQWKILLPLNGQTNSANFDVTLIVFLIRNCCLNSAPPVGSWQIASPLPSDTSIAANCVRLRNLRNTVYHCPDPGNLSEIEFNDFWNKIDNIFTAMKYQKSISYLYSGSLEPYKNLMNKSRIALMQRELTDLKQEIVSKNKQLENLESINENIEQLIEALAHEEVDLAYIKAQTYNITFDNEGLKRALERMQEKFKVFEETLASRLDNVSYQVNRLFEEKANQETVDELFKEIDKLSSSIGNQACGKETRTKGIASTTTEQYTNNREELIIALNSEKKLTFLKCSKANNLMDVKDILYICVRGLYHILINVGISDRNETICLHFKEGDDNKCQLIENGYDGINHGYYNSKICVGIHCHNNSEVKNALESSAENSPEFIEYKVNGSQMAMQLEYSQWKELCQKYISEYFCCQGDVIKESIQFPPHYVLQSPVSTFGLWFLNRFLESNVLGPGVVISSYDTHEHLEFLNYKQNFKTNHHAHDSLSYSNRIIVLNRTLNVLLNVRYTDRSDFQSIYTVQKRGNNDLKLFYFVHQKELLQSNMLMFNVIIAPNYDGREHTFLCKECIIIDKEHLVTENAFKKWWYMFLKKVQIMKEEIDTSEKLPQNVFMTIVASIFTFMAMRRIDLPKIKGSLHNKVLSALLTVEQQKVVYSKENKFIVDGSFGCGKSVVGICLSKVIIEGSVNLAILFYICYDDICLLPEQIETILKHHSCRNVTTVITNFKKLASSLGLNCPSLPHLLGALLRKHDGIQVHVIIDEYNGEHLDLHQATTLCEMFTTRKELEHSYCVLLTHSMKKMRMFESYGDVLPHQMYQYNATGMKFYNLSKCMRNSQKVFDVIKTCEEFMTKAANTLYHPTKKSDFERRKSIWSKRSSESQKSVPKPSFSNVSDTAMPQLEQRIEFKNNLTGMDDLDVIGKGIILSRCDKNVKTITSYQFHPNTILGTRINGTKPILLCVNESLDISHKVSKLSIALDVMCLSLPCTKLFLSNSADDCSILIKALQLLDQDFILYDSSTDWKRQHSSGKVLDHLPKDGFNLLTNYRGCRGMEFEDVIIFLNLNDVFEKQYIVESVSRCTSRLFLLLYQDYKDVRHLPANSVSELIMELVKTKQVDVVNFLTFQDPNQETVLIEQETTIFRAVQNLYINVMSPKFNDLICSFHKLKEFQSKWKETKHYGAEIFSLLEKPRMVADIQCIYYSNTSCLLVWKGAPYNYNIRQRAIFDRDTSDWEDVASGISSTEFLVSGLSLESEYEFCVIAVGRLGESEPSFIIYKHRVKDDSDGYLYKELEHSVFSGDILIINEVLTMKPGIVNLRGPNLRTLLHEAALFGSTGIIKLLISHGADLNARDCYGKSVYHVAAETREIKCLEYLLNLDHHSINLVDHSGRSPLHYACMWGQIDAVELLLKMGADTEIQDVNGGTAYSQTSEWEIYTGESNQQAIQSLIEFYQL